ncbi:MAG: hypothetical protein H0T76_19675 [Nannocystis sp.]|nr:hypothetical protein [Nannocystis sp.]MBA3548712.1 hypothetical protein [Nannocystis sp.]
MAARTPGPIAAAEPQLATLGEYRQLHLALTEADATHPWLKAIELPTELELEAVEALEQSLSASFSDALLAVYASRVPHLEDAFEMQLEGLTQLGEEAWAVGCPADMLAVARQADLFFCVPRREHPWAVTMVIAWHPLDGAGAPRPLPRWLRDVPMADLWEVLHELQAVDAGQDEPPPAARVEVGVPLTPRLVPHRSTVLQAAPRVQHPKFGVGRVLRATGGGSDRKLEIDFGGGGVRTILARFVTELPPEA